MALSWSEIHELEVREDYPAAIDVLEERLRADPDDREAVIRLGFNLWIATTEAMRMQKSLPTELYAARFVELFRQYRSRLETNADFCWAFGLGISLDWFDFPGTDQALGNALMERARELDPFWRRIYQADGQAELAERFRGRGIFASYYGVA